MAASGSVPVSLDALGALAHRTRFRVLRALLERPKTVSELGRELEVSKGTVHRHLETLAEAGFVSRREDDRQWVYHELTDEGEALASADRPQVVIELGASLVLGAVGLAAALARGHLASRFAPEAEGPVQGGPQAPGGNGTGGNGTGGGGEASLLADPLTWLAAGAVLVLLAVLLVLLARRQLRSSR